MELIKKSKVKEKNRNPLRGQSLNTSSRNNLESFIKVSNMVLETKTMNSTDEVVVKTAE